MEYAPKVHRRRSIRLQHYDYTQNGAYFITLCTQNHTCLFGQIISGEMHLNNAGEMLEFHWLSLIDRFDKIELDEFVIMPNHFHAIINITNLMMTNARPCRKVDSTLGQIVGTFKSLSTNDYIRNVKQNNWHRFDKKLWQRNFYEHIIRDETAYYQILEYIQTNPLRWQDDAYYCDPSM